MITRNQLLEASYKTDLVKLINNFIEKEIREERNLERQKELIELYSEGWGDVATWIGDKWGKFRKGIKDFGRNISQAYSRANPEPEGYSAPGTKPMSHDLRMRFIKKAYGLLSRTGLLNNITLKRALDQSIKELENQPEQKKFDFAADQPKQKEFDFAAEHSLGFKEWLLNETALPKHYRPELNDPEIKKLEISVGDIVEMGPETQSGGKDAGRIGQVKEVSEKEVLLRDLTRPGKTMRVKISDLHDKEQLRGSRLLPKDEAQLKALGGKKLWVKLTERQMSKFAARYRAPEMPEIVPMTHDESPSAALRKMFGREEEKPEELLPMFTKKKQGESAPLRRFLAAKKGIL